MQGLQSESSGREPEHGKIPKVVGRGCKRFFEPRERKWGAPVQNMAQCKTVQKTLGRLLLPGLKRPFAPSPTTFGTLPFSGSLPELSDCNAGDIEGVVRTHEPKADRALHLRDGALLALLLARAAGGLRPIARAPDAGADATQDQISCQAVGSRMRNIRRGQVSRAKLSQTPLFWLVAPSDTK